MNVLTNLLLLLKYNLIFLKTRIENPVKNVFKKINIFYLIIS